MFTPNLQTADEEVSSLYGDLIMVRRYLHEHPEPSGEEFETTQYLARKFTDHGIPFRLGPDNRGIIVDGGSLEGPRIALRADIDALRLQDEKTVVYRSKERNLMHACGHDAHTAMLYGAVLALYRMFNSEDAPFAWRAIFQPSEETATGALDMIDHGALEGVGQIIALHVDPTLIAGQIGFRKGALTANCEEFEVLIEGEGGHGARPHTTRDPIAAAAHWLHAAYALTPRSHDSRDPSVLSVGVIQGGINPNVIPDSVQLRGTLRTISKEGSRGMKAKLKSICDHIGNLTETKITLQIAYSLDGVYNDEGMIEVCRQACQDLIPGGAITLNQPSMGGEDFASYLRHCKGCMLRLGTGTPLQPIHHLHSSRFDVNENALPIGCKALVRSALSLAAKLHS